MHTCEEGWAQLGPGTASPESEGKPAELKRFGSQVADITRIVDDLKHDLTSYAKTELISQDNNFLALRWSRLFLLRCSY